MSTVQGLLITGDTYTSRRDLKALGGKWYPDREGWVVPLTQCEAAEKLAGGKNFIVEIIDVEAEALERPTGERLRGIRQDRLDGKIGRWRARAERLEAQAAALDKQLAPYDDFAFWTQPILVGHHSERSHRKLRDRLGAKMDRAMQLRREARELRERADSAEKSGARIAGDAERKRQEERDTLDEQISVGATVFDFAFGKGTVVRVNKKTYSIRFESGSTYARDKSFVRPAA